MANSNGITTIEQFADHYRLHIRRDECNDQIIPGRRGHLYFDVEVLCLMATDRKIAQAKTWQSLGGKLWLGGISPNGEGSRVQDVKIIGVQNPREAMRLCGIFPRRELSEEHRAKVVEALAKMRKDS